MIKIHTKTTKSLVIDFRKKILAERKCNSIKYIICAPKWNTVR